MYKQQSLWVIRLSFSFFVCLASYMRFDWTVVCQKDVKQQYGWHVQKNSGEGTVKRGDDGMWWGVENVQRCWEMYVVMRCWWSAKDCPYSSSFLWTRECPALYTPWPKVHCFPGPALYTPWPRVSSIVHSLAQRNEDESRQSLTLHHQHLITTYTFLNTLHFTV